MKIERVFALLIESGVIYCCVWVCPEISSQKGSPYYFQILFWISMMGLLPSPGLTPMVFVSVSTVDVFLLHILNTDLT